MNPSPSVGPGGGRSGTSRLPPAGLPKLRWLLATGEAVSPALCRRWLTLYPHIPVVNAYGPAECSDDVTLHTAAEPPAPDATAVPIGRPLPNLRVYVLDARLEPVPRGVRGELWVGGIGVGRGYRNDSRRTAEVFWPDPFGAEPGARLYRTGDLARWLPDGTLVFLGRLDRQVKLRGFRIELEEVESALRQHPGVRESLVVLRNDHAGTPQLIAYVLPDVELANAAASDLRHFLRGRLPPYMVPSAVVLLERFPLTPNGKIDHRALPLPDITSQGAALLPPRTPAETMLARLWAEVLGLDRVGAEDSFFDLGGHSLRAVQLIARLRKELELDIPLRIVFESPELGSMAEAIDQLVSDRDHRILEEVASLSEEDAQALLDRIKQESMPFSQYDRG